MTLKNKFLELKFCICEDETQIDNFVELADKQSLEFAEWMVSGVEFLDDTERGRIYLYKHNRYTTQELLEIYKKEKEL